jgi:hypothetical protein
LIAAVNVATFWTVPRRIRLSVISRNQRSTNFRQELDVGKNEDETVDGALLHWQNLLSQVNCLNLTFLVDTELHGLVRMIYIWPNDVVQPLDEILVAA